MKYTHGGDIYRYDKKLIDFSSNINPFGMPEGVRNAAMAAVMAAENYPDHSCRKLREQIARREGVLPEQIICGNGAAELIYSLAYAIKPRYAVMQQPTFSEYAAAVRAAAGSGEMITFLCNPNNPTGTLTEKEEVIRQIKECQGIFVLDECFNDFLDEPARYSCVDRINEYKNLIILKSFTKMYAMPGLRLGYAISANTELIERMYGARQAWSVSSVAQAAGLAVCADYDTPERMRRYLRHERSYMASELDRLGLAYIDPTANFIFFKAPPGLKERLIGEGILIRSCADYMGLDDTCYRAAIKLHKENEVLTAALQRLIR